MAIENAAAMAAAIETYGRKIDVTVTHGADVYTTADIVSFKLSAEGALLRSVMAQADVELDGAGGAAFAASMVGESVSISLTVTADGDSAKRDFGAFIVREAEYDDDAGTVRLTAYDGMLRAMVPYTPTVDFSGGSVTLGGYFAALCRALGLPADTAEFTNSGVWMDSDPFDDSYTFRDVFDAVAQAAGGMVAVRGGRVCVLYPTAAGKTIDPSNLKALKIGECCGPINCVVLARSPQEDNLYRRDENAESWKEIRIENNPIMDSHRDDFIDGLYTRLSGLTYYPTEITSYGIGWAEIGDLYTLETTDGDTYTTICLSDSWDVAQGMTETIIAEAPTQTETDYAAADTTDRRINQTILRVDKQEQRIEAAISSTEQTTDALTGQLSEVTKKVESTMTAEQVQIFVKKEIGEIDSVTTSTGFTFDENGLTVEKSGAGTKTTVDETGLTVQDANGAAAEELLYAGVDSETKESVVKAKNIRVSKYLIVGQNSRFEDYEADGEPRTGCFFIG